MYREDDLARRRLDLDVKSIRVGGNTVEIGEADAEGSLWEPVL